MSGREEEEGVVEGRGAERDEGPETCAAAAGGLGGPGPLISAERAGEQRGAVVAEIPLERIAPDPQQPRREFSEKTLTELADSIRRYGVLEPIIVRPAPGARGKGRFLIVAGERRYRASREAGRRTIPAMIRHVSGSDALVLALVENVHRDDLSDVDKAHALQRLKMREDLTWEKVAELVGLSAAHVKALGGLVRLEPEVKLLVQAGKISGRAALALVPLPPTRQVETAAKAAAGGWSAEQVRHETSRLGLRRHRGFAPAKQAGAGDGGRFRRGPAPPAVRGAGGHAGEEPPGEPQAAHDDVSAGRLRQYEARVAEMAAYVEGREWSPHNVSEPEEEALERLYRAVAQLQQRLIEGRAVLRGARLPA